MELSSDKRDDEKDNAVVKSIPSFNEAQAILQKAGTFFKDINLKKNNWKKIYCLRFTMSVLQAKKLFKPISRIFKR